MMFIGVTLVSYLPMPYPCSGIWYSLSAAQRFEPSVEILLAARPRCSALFNPLHDFILEEVEPVATLAVRYALLGSHAVDGGSRFAEQGGDFFKGKQAALARVFSCRLAQYLVHLSGKLLHPFYHGGNSLRQLFKCDVTHIQSSILVVLFRLFERYLFGSLALQVVHYIRIDLRCRHSAVRKHF